MIPAGHGRNYTSILPESEAFGHSVWVRQSGQWSGFRPGTRVR